MYTLLLASYSQFWLHIILEEFPKYTQFPSSEIHLVWKDPEVTNLIATRHNWAEHHITGMELCREYLSREMSRSGLCFREISLTGVWRIDGKKRKPGRRLAYY